MIASYRDPSYAASLRIDHLRERVGESTDDIPQELASIHGRRVARSWAGGVAVAGFVVMALATLEKATSVRSGARADLPPTSALIVAVLASVATYALVRPLASIAFVHRVRSSFDDRGDVASRLARLETNIVRRAALQAVDRGEKWSIALPMMGLSLLAPLTIHLAIWMLFGIGKGSAQWLSDFDTWITLSLCLVGLAHLALAGMCVWFAGKIAKSPTSELQSCCPVSGWVALGWTVIASFVPGVIAFLIPPIVVAITGLLFIPAMFGVMHRRALAERHTLEA